MIASGVKLITELQILDQESGGVNMRQMVPPAWSNQTLMFRWTCGTTYMFCLETKESIKATIEPSIS